MGTPDKTNRFSKLLNQVKFEEVVLLIFVSLNKITGGKINSVMTTKESILDSIKNFRPQLTKLGIKDIGLFGSYSRNEYSKQSDIDILIDFEPDKENFDNYMEIYDLLENLFKDEKIEVVTKNGLSPYIGPNILKEVVYV